MEKYLTAIIIYAPNFGRVKNAAKYRNIKNTEQAKRRFEKFVSMAFPEWENINYYGKESKKFMEQIRNTQLNETIK